ncbi:Ca2+ regulator and membrane fusion protein Fig1-domain-containing protein [Hypomontagnella monticulosa]|nr:Ca2+ regulator and membrane fusion protein Fig1-domain-containing protein [Hypomontagnella monticulosa]
MAGTRKIFDSVGYRSMVYLAAVGIIVLYALTLTGCVSDSPGIPNIFLVNVQSQGIETMNIRVGYYGMCVDSPKGFECVSSIAKYASTLENELLGTTNSTIDDIDRFLSIAATTQWKLFPCLLAGAGVAFFYSSAALLILKCSFKKPSRKNRSSIRSIQRAILLLSEFAVILAFTSAMVTMTTARALEFATSSDSSVMEGNDIHLSPGVLLQILQWLIVGFSVLFQVALSNMFGVQGGGIAAGLLPLHAPTRRHRDRALPATNSGAPRPLEPPETLSALPRPRSLTH